MIFSLASPVDIRKPHVTWCWQATHPAAHIWSTMTNNVVISYINSFSNSFPDQNGTVHTLPESVFCGNNLMIWCSSVLCRQGKQFISLHSSTIWPYMPHRRKGWWWWWWWWHFHYIRELTKWCEDCALFINRTDLGAGYHESPQCLSLFSTCFWSACWSSSGV